jgi:hypothetical protein
VTSDTALAAATNGDGTERQRKLALLKAVGLDRLSEPERELALNIAQRYELDLLLKHLVIIEGRAYITRDGLLHVAHRSGVFDGLEVTPAVLESGFWRSTVTAYRKDMTRGFTYPGRYPENGNNKRYAPEMAIKVAEVMALRRAFDVSVPVAEERWADEAIKDAAPAEPTKSLRDRARERAEATKSPAEATANPESDAELDAVVDSLP